MSTPKTWLAAIAAGERLSETEAEAAFGAIMRGEFDDAQIAGLLTGLRLRGETTDEIRGAVRAMRAAMHRVDAPDDAIDVVGTGGDLHGTLNVSTAVAFVVAGAGVPVAKHGNRAVSSITGAADVLSALGAASLDGSGSDAGRALAEDGLAFLFAPAYHPALRHAAAARRALGFRTIFNLLGPLANPAGVRRQLVGVYDPRWLGPLAETLASLGSDRAWVVHGAGGLDELGLSGPSQVTAIEDGAIRSFEVHPEQAGLPQSPLEAIRGGDAAHNAAALVALLDGAQGAYRDIVLFNAAAALMIAARAVDLREGVALAAESLDAGAAKGVLRRLRARIAAARTDPATV